MKPIETTEQTFKNNVLCNKRTVLVHFGAKWCAPCKRVEPVLEELAEEMAGTISLQVIDVDDNQDLAYSLQISSIPTFVIFQNGSLKDRMLGAVPKSVFLNFIDRNRLEEESSVLEEGGDFLALTLAEGRIKVVKIKSDGSCDFLDGTSNLHNLLYTCTLELISLREAGQELEDLINDPHCREQDLHRFFENHPEFILFEEHERAHSKVLLERQNGEVLIPDFLLEPLDKNALCDLLELKLPGARAYALKKGRFRFSAAVMEAAAQLREYAAFFDDEKNRLTVEQKYGLRTYRPRMFVILGKSGTLDPIERRRVESDLPGITLYTYDEVLARMRRKIR